MQGYFEKHFVFCKAHPLLREQEVFFNIRTKSPGLNHSGITAVSHWFSFLARPYLNCYTGRSQPTAMSKLDKTFPLLILPVLHSLHNLGFEPYEFRLSDCPHSLEWLYLS
jgi:hypothetical protein